MDEGEGEFSFFDVGAEAFADGFLLAADIEDVVDDLEGRSDLPAVESQRFDPRGRFGGEHGAQAAAGLGEGGGFSVDDEVVGFFVERPVALVVVLGQLAFADGVGGVGDEAAGVGAAAGAGSRGWCRGDRRGR